MIKRDLAPFSTVSDQCVCKDDKLPHDGCHGYLARFSGSDDLIEFATSCPVVLDRAKRWHE